MLVLSALLFYYLFDGLNGHSCPSTFLCFWFFFYYRFTTVWFISVASPVVMSCLIYHWLNSSCLMCSWFILLRPHCNLYNYHKYSCLLFVLNIFLVSIHIILYGILLLTIHTAGNLYDKVWHVASLIGSSPMSVSSWSSLCW